MLKSLRKEPERRYASVEQLIDDLDRWRTGRPVSARPDTLGYRVRKLVGRHRVASGFALASLVLLVGFAITMTVQARNLARAKAAVTEERDRAEREHREDHDRVFESESAPHAYRLCAPVRRWYR